MHTCIHTYVETCLHICIHTCIYTCIRTNIHAYLHTCMQMYTETATTTIYVRGYVFYPRLYMLGAAIYSTRGYIFYMCVYIPVQVYIFCAQIYALCTTIYYIQLARLCYKHSEDTPIFLKAHISERGVFSIRRSRHIEYLICIGDFQLNSSINSG